MKYLMMMILFSALLISCGSDKKAEAENHQDHKPMQESMAQSDGERLIYYTCPMESHKHIHSKEPGSCPECNMTLVAGVITSEDKMEYYGCPMVIHSHVRHDEPGNCAECKMKLKPMRLKTS